MHTIPKEVQSRWNTLCESLDVSPTPLIVLAPDYHRCAAMEFYSKTKVARLWWHPRTPPELMTDTMLHEIAHWHDCQRRRRVKHDYEFVKILKAVATVHYGDYKRYLWDKEYDIVQKVLKKIERG